MPTVLAHSTTTKTSDFDKSNSHSHFGGCTVPSFDLTGFDDNAMDGLLGMLPEAEPDFGYLMPVSLNLTDKFDDEGSCQTPNTKSNKLLKKTISKRRNEKHRIGRTEIQKREGKHIFLKKLSSQPLLENSPTPTFEQSVQMACFSKT